MSWFSDAWNKIEKETKKATSGKGVQVNPVRDTANFFDDVGDVGEDVSDFFNEATGQKQADEAFRENAKKERENKRLEQEAKSGVEQQLEGLESDYETFKQDRAGYESDVMSEIDRKIYNQVKDAMEQQASQRYNRGLIATGGGMQKAAGEIGLLGATEEARLDTKAKQYFEDLEMQIAKEVQDAQYAVANLEASEAEKELNEAIQAMKERSQALGDFWESVGTIGGYAYSAMDED